MEVGGDSDDFSSFDCDWSSTSKGSGVGFFVRFGLGLARDAFLLLLFCLLKLSGACTAHKPWHVILAVGCTVLSVQVSKSHLHHVSEVKISRCKLLLSKMVENGNAPPKMALPLTEKT